MSDKDLYDLICLFREFIDIYIDPNDSEYSEEIKAYPKGAACGRLGPDKKADRRPWREHHP